MPHLRALWKSCGMSGADGDLSFSKLITLMVLLAFACGRGFPSAVAITLIASAHGTRVLLALIRSRTVTAAAANRIETTLTITRDERLPGRTDDESRD